MRPTVGLGLVLAVLASAPAPPARAGAPTPDPIFRPGDGGGAGGNIVCSAPEWCEDWGFCWILFGECHVEGDDDGGPGDVGGWVEPPETYDECMLYAFDAWLVCVAAASGVQGELSCDLARSAAEGNCATDFPGGPGDGGPAQGGPVGES